MKPVSCCRLRIGNAEAKEGSVKEAPVKEVPVKEVSAREVPAREAPAKAVEDPSQKKADSVPHKSDTDWKTRYTMHGIYLVPADQVSIVCDLKMA